LVLRHSKESRKPFSEGDCKLFQFTQLKYDSADIGT
jgi:hypothetical protein